MSASIPRGRRNYISAAMVLSLMLCSVVFEVSYAENRPWRIDRAADTPPWLSISGQHRSRFETLDEQFRTGRNGDDQIMVFRTSVLAKLMFDHWQVGLEILDARQARADDDTPVSNNVVNPVDLLQAYAQWTMKDVFLPNSISNVRLGRFTIDVGSRRFVARNLFRNTINAFTGVDWRLSNTQGQEIRVFYTLPVNRLPRERERLIDNRSEADDQDTEVQFWGAYYKFPGPTFSHWNGNAELYYFGLDENDTHNRPTRNRDIHTIGGRVFTNKLRNKVDFQIESAIQFGQSRPSSASSSQNDLDHFAHFHRVELGYTLNHKWSPRFSAQLDFASGDDDPDDNDQHRFDPLFGARRFDFGPTGIYGPFVRSNLISPGLRIQLKPTSKTSIFFAHRGYWLASDKDAWVVAGVRDPAGESGSFIGHQFETRFRWNIIPDSLRFEVGGAYLFKGRFADNAPGTNDEGDPNYLYSQLLITF